MIYFKDHSMEITELKTEVSVTSVNERILRCFLSPVFLAFVCNTAGFVRKKVKQSEACIMFSLY